MSRVLRIERLLTNASHRLELAQREVSKIRAEIKELTRRLEEAKAAEEQLSLPFGAKARRPSEKWAAVLNYMLVRSPHAISIDDILHFASENGFDITRTTARAQLHHYLQRGIVQRIADGLYLPTDAAKAFCDF